MKEQALQTGRLARGLRASLSALPIAKIRPGPWLVPVFAFMALYAWRPLILGFYSDDWSILVEGTRYGAPFSLDRLEWFTEAIPYARPLQILEQFLASSVLGRSTWGWHLFLVLLVALSCVTLRRLLVALGVSSRRATLTCGLWLVLPWSLGYTAWPITTPILLSSICFLNGSVSLLRTRIWPSLGWYTACFLLYEAFYLQFAVILAILLFSAETRQWALRRAVGPLLLLQIAVVGANRWVATLQPQMAKLYDPDWPLLLAKSLIRLPATLALAISLERVAAVVLVSLAAVFVVASALRAREGMRRARLLAVSLGVLLSFLVLSLAGYWPVSIGHFSRTLVATNVWLVAFVALSLPTRLHGAWVARGAKLLVAACFVLLAASTVSQNINWHNWWKEERVVVRAIPVEALKALDPRAVVLALGMPSVDEWEVFGDTWGLTAALGNEVPATRTSLGNRQFAPAVPGEKVTWDGRRLLKENSREPVEGRELWLWRWPSRHLELVTTPGSVY